MASLAYVSSKVKMALWKDRFAACVGLADGCPDGSEESQLQEVEEEVKKHSAEVKQYKERNAQVRTIHVSTFACVLL